jgi:hypothetical protein
VQLGAAGTQLRFNATPEKAASTKDGISEGDADSDLCISARNVDSLCGKTLFLLEQLPLKVVCSVCFADIGCWWQLHGDAILQRAGRDALPCAAKYSTRSSSQTTYKHK